LANDISYAVGQKTSKKQVPELLSTGLPNVCLSGNCDKQVSTVKWITPTDDVCKANGGKINENDICSANWKNANTICFESHERTMLPSISDFKEVIDECGGIWRDWGKNPYNSSYKSCYKDKGFSGFDSYWTFNSNDSSNAWHVLLTDAVPRHTYQGNIHHVRCVVLPKN